MFTKLELKDGWKEIIKHVSSVFAAMTIFVNDDERMKKKDNRHVSL